MQFKLLVLSVLASVALAAPITEDHDAKFWKRPIFTHEVPSPDSAEGMILDAVGG